MLTNIDKFKNDLEALKEKYKITLYESDQYNGMDEYVGTDQYFVFEGDRYYVNTVEQIIRKVFLSKDHK